MHLQGPQIFVVRSGTGQAYLRNPPGDNQPAILHKDIKLKAGSESLHGYVIPWGCISHLSMKLPRTVCCVSQTNL